MLRLCCSFLFSKQVREGATENLITYKRPEAKAEGRENANSLTNRMLAALKMYKLLHKPMHPWRIMVHSL